MIDCPIYLSLPQEEAVVSTLQDDPTGCEGCNCGYVQYEGLIPYLAEIRDSLNLTGERSVDFEFKLREQVVEISRLFDIDAGVRPGFFSKAHYRTSKTVLSKGNRYIKIPDFVLGTLEVRTMDDEVIDPNTYEYRDNHLVWKPCQEHISCGCGSGCRESKLATFVQWPDSCYKVRAKWGKMCADLAVQRAVREYLIETYRMQDPVIQLANGITMQRKFQVPHSWTTYIKNFKDKKKIFSNFAIA